MAIDLAVKAELGKEAARIEEDAVFSEKGHYNAVTPWRWVHRFLGLLAAAGSALAAVAVLKSWSPDIAIGTATIATLASLVLTSLKPSEEADRHQRAGDRYLAVKNRARIFQKIDLTLANPVEDKLADTLKALSAGLDDVRSSAPVIPRWAYRKAKKEIEKGTADYRVDR